MYCVCCASVVLCVVCLCVSCVWDVRVCVGCVCMCVSLTRFRVSATCEDNFTPRYVIGSEVCVCCVCVSACGACW